jgi:hypothetical protein
MVYAPSADYTRARIVERLQDDTIIQDLVGVILNRPPKRKGDDQIATGGATPSAFDADQRLKPTIYVPEPTRGPGNNQQAFPLAYQDVVRVAFVGPADEERKDILRAAKYRTSLLLRLMYPDALAGTHNFTEPWYFINRDGRKMFAEMSPPVDTGLPTSEIMIGGGGSVEGYLIFRYNGQSAR